MFFSNRKKWLLLLVPVIFFSEPIFSLFRNLNYYFWDTVRSVVSYGESNPLMVLLVIIILLFASKH